MNEELGARAASRDESIAPIYRSAILILVWGFRLSAGLLLAGLLVALVKRESLRSQTDPLPDVIPTVLDGRAAGIIDLAILVMMATPVVTVVAVAIGFFRAGDRRYGLISLLVLAILGVSVVRALLA